MQSTIRCCCLEALGPLDRDDSCECPVDSDGLGVVAVQVRGLVMAPGCLYVIRNERYDFSKFRKLFYTYEASVV